METPLQGFIRLLYSAYFSSNEVDLFDLDDRPESVGEFERLEKEQNEDFVRLIVFVMENYPTLLAKFNTVKPVAVIKTKSPTELQQCNCSYCRGVK